MKKTLLPALLGLLAMVLSPAATPPPPGAGAVLEMHRQLFRALDEGNDAPLRSLLASVSQGATWTPDEGWGDSQGFLAYGPPDGGGANRATSVEDGRALLQRWAGERGWQTRITHSWSDCASAELSYAVLELERSRPSASGGSGGSGEEVERYRSTSLVSHRDGRWVLWHLHLSRA